MKHIDYESPYGLLLSFLKDKEMCHCYYTEAFVETPHIMAVKTSM